MNYTFFRSGPFSNWYSSKFVLNGVEYTSAEQAMMHLKAIHFKDSETAEQILATTNPRKQKELGRGVKNYVDTEWNDVRYKYALEFLYAKFTQNEDLMQSLLATCDSILVEASPVDTVWGIGLAEDNLDILDESKWRGTNLLGKALTEVKQRIKGDTNVI